MRIFGRVKLKEGLYCLYHEFQNFAFLDAVSTNIWHNRLGHTSSNRLKYILSNYNLITNNTVTPFKVCDVCHYSKQSRSSFPNTAF